MRIAGEFESGFAMTEQNTYSKPGAIEKIKPA